jgi:hypothetical protein
MSNVTVIVVAPPSGEAPSVLQLGAVSYFPDTSGHFSVPALFALPLLASGWTRIS